MNNKLERDYAFDNIKLIVIFLVVFAHLLEISRGYTSNSTIYRVIYSFHMPLFMFISGYFAKFSKKLDKKNQVLFKKFFVIFKSTTKNLKNEVIFKNMLYNIGGYLNKQPFMHSECIILINLFIDAIMAERAGNPSAFFFL